MISAIRPLVAGNWKMNGTSASLQRAAWRSGSGFMSGLDAETEALLCVPATLLSRASEILSRTPVKSGGQDCHWQQTGAAYRRHLRRNAEGRRRLPRHRRPFRAPHRPRRDRRHRLAKAEAAWRAGLVAIVCIGETRAERETGATLDDPVTPDRRLGACSRHAIRQRSIAYEPVWAIGTGLTPTADDVAEAHAHIRKELAGRIGAEADRMRILYGGSVKPSNARELLSIANVDGALVGGASLKAADFLGIADAYRGI